MSATAGPLKFVGFSAEISRNKDSHQALPTPIVCKRE
jgi:hypothetical protein